MGEYCRLLNATLRQGVNLRRTDSFPKNEEIFAIAHALGWRENDIIRMSYHRNFYIFQKIGDEWDFVEDSDSWSEPDCENLSERDNTPIEVFDGYSVLSQICDELDEFTHFPQFDDENACNRCGEEILNIASLSKDNNFFF